MFVYVREIARNFEIASKKRRGTAPRLVFEFSPGRYESERGALEDEFLRVVHGYGVREAVIHVLYARRSEIMPFPFVFVVLSVRKSREGFLAVGQFVRSVGQAEFQMGVLRNRCGELGFPCEFSSVREGCGSVEIVSEEGGSEPLRDYSGDDGHRVEMPVEYLARSVYGDAGFRRDEYVRKNGIGLYGSVYRRAHVASYGGKPCRKFVRLGVTKSDGRGKIERSQGILL